MGSFSKSMILPVFLFKPSGFASPELAVVSVLVPALLLLSSVPPARPGGPLTLLKGPRSPLENSTGIPEHNTPDKMLSDILNPLQQKHEFRVQRSVGTDPVLLGFLLF